MYNAMANLPKFRVKGDKYQYYFVQFVKGKENRIMSWQEKGIGDCACELVWPHNVEGGKDSLVGLGVWDRLSDKERLAIDSAIEVQTETKKPVSEIVVTAPVEQPIVTEPVTNTTVPVQEPVAETISIPKTKRVVMIKLPDGTIRPRTRGRQPLGAVVVETIEPEQIVELDGHLAEPIKNEPTVETPKAKPIVMIKLLDGTIRPRTRGRQPLGSVVVA